MTEISEDESSLRNLNQLAYDDGIYWWTKVINWVLAIAQICIILKGPGAEITVWFQNRRAKFRKQERLAQQKASNTTNENTNPPSNIKAESNGTSKNSLGGGNGKEVKPGSPHSSISTTPNSNTSSISSHQSSNGIDVKPVNNNGKLSDDSLLSNNNKWSMSPQSCNTALLVHQANKVLSSQPSHLQSHHHHHHNSHHAAAAAAAALSSPFTSLLGASGGAASYLLGDHLKPATAANHLF